MVKLQRERIVNFLGSEDILGRRSIDGRVERDRERVLWDFNLAVDLII